MAADEVVDLDQDISAYYSYRVSNARFPTPPITLRQLMSHTSSIMDTGVYSISASTIGSMLDISLKRRSNFSDKNPGKAHLYTNLGAGVVSSIMEAVTGESLNSLMNHLAFKPMGIDTASQPFQKPGRYVCCV